MISGLHNALTERGLEGKVGIIADESSSLSNAQSEYADWLPDVIDMVEALVHHTYDFPSDSTYQSYANFVAQNYPGKATWMSVSGTQWLMQVMLTVGLAGSLLLFR